MKYLLLALLLSPVLTWADESTAGDLKEGKPSRSVTCPLGSVAVHINDVTQAGDIKLMYAFARFGWRSVLNDGREIVYTGNYIDNVAMTGPTQFRLHPAEGVTAKYWLNCKRR